MKMILKSFSQDVNLEDPDSVVYSLVFSDGENLHYVPVPEETVSALIEIVYGRRASAADSYNGEDHIDPGEDHIDPEESSLPDLEDTSEYEFGGHDVPDLEEPSLPSSEDEIPSL